MCGRITQKAKREEFSEFVFGFDPETDLYLPNIKPTQSVRIVVLDDEDPLTTNARWWFQKEDAKEFSTEYTTFNARSDKIASSFLYKRALAQKRCLVPVSAFYEWSEKGKPPHEIYLQGKHPFALAGLWSSYQEEGTPKRSFTIITCEPNRFMSSIHNRMPVILRDLVAQERWLREGDPELLATFSEEMESKRLSNPIENEYPVESI